MFPVIRVLVLTLVVSVAWLSAAENLVRNGSFEGGQLYWHDQNDQELVEDAKVGQYALKLTKGWTLSAPIGLEHGAEYTISLWAKSTGGESRVGIGMPPMAREVAQKRGRIWTKGATKSVTLTGEWQRISVTWAADQKPGRMWPLPQYGIYFSANDKRPPILIDGITVTKGTEPSAEYIPRAPIEVVAVPTNLPGYRGAAGNMYKKGETATLDGFASNPGASARTLTARWQLIDYEGIEALADPVDQEIVLAAGATLAVPVSLPLSANGTVLARFSVLDGTELIDSSSVPLCSLPYEKAATVPNYEERFGGSFAGGVECLERMQRIGFGWTRWWANNKWHDYEPEEGVYKWSMDRQEEAWKRGISNHVVLYGWPKWIMDKDNPLPRDMRWEPEDPRWDDLSVVTAWDRFVTAAVENFRGKPVVLQIANEPGHDRWKDKDEWKKAYVKFNLRTARLIRKLDPEVKISINNVYGNPSSVNGALLGAKKMQDFDIWSWHDYHAGWIGDASLMKRMSDRLADANGEHMEVWLTEGWAFTNTLVDQPIACTSLTSVQSTHAIMNSVVEMTASGHDKFVMFHLQYGTHGMSFWDYSGPGNMIWDWYSYPTALVGGWNVLIHHIGYSDQIGLVRPPGANFGIFTDKRNQRGVMVAYADRNAKADITVELPISGLTAEDIQGNPVQLDGNTLTLKQNGRPVILYTASGTGEPLFAALEPLDRKHLGFVEAGAGGTKVYKLPETWQGSKRGTSDGNPALSGDKPIWRLDHLYPTDSKMPENYKPMVWTGTNWLAPDHSQGGHPSGALKDGVLRMGSLGPWGGNEYNYRKQGALAFIVPEAGLYRIQCTASSHTWGGTKRDVYLSVMKKDEQRVGEIEKFALKADKTKVTIDVEVEASEGHELLLLNEMPHHNSSTGVVIQDLTITKQ
ncbi:MAG: carbohydrate binding domain-containing protein [Planctomycetota bacterium]|jgi:hypothetical protein|nr:carbohydrate binding domain-containing protein [Planctomycetota bacterium]